MAVKKRSSSYPLTLEKKILALVVLLLGGLTMLSALLVVTQSTQQAMQAARRPSSLPSCQQWSDDCSLCLQNGCRFCTDLNSSKTLCASQKDFVIATYRCITSPAACPAPSAPSPTPPTTKPLTLELPRQDAVTIESVKLIPLILDYYLLSVKATSSRYPQAVLTVRGYGQMTYRPQDHLYVLNRLIRGRPDTVTVVSSFGGHHQLAP